MYIKPLYNTHHKFEMASQLRSLHMCGCTGNFSHCTIFPTVHYIHVCSSQIQQCNTYGSTSIINLMKVKHLNTSHGDTNNSIHFLYIINTKLTTNQKRPKNNTTQPHSMWCAHDLVTCTYTCHATDSFLWIWIQFPPHYSNSKPSRSASCIAYL